MATVSALIDGYKRFYRKHFLDDESVYKELATGQSPKTLIIACSDSRVDPSIVMDANAGDIFVIRNVANLVPPYQPKGDSYHGTSAALEFGVNHLNVENIVILGHSSCAGIHALLHAETQPKNDEFSFIAGWVNIAKDAKEQALQKCTADDSDTQKACEQEGILTSLHNLMTFPWIKEKVAAGTLTLHGWYFSVADGKLHAFDKSTKSFEEIAV